eukprot:6348525-Pyramimonas_sp.AAC.1
MCSGPSTAQQPPSASTACSPCCALRGAAEPRSTDSRVDLAAGGSASRQVGATRARPPSREAREASRESPPASV